MAALTVIDGAVPLVAAWAIRALLDEIASGNARPSALALGIAALVASGVLATTGKAAQTYLQTCLQREIRLTAQLRLFQAIHCVQELAFFEDSAELDKIRLAEDGGESAPADIIMACSSVLQAVITGVGFAVAILVLCPWLAVAVLAAGVPACMLQLKSARRNADAVVATSPYYRHVIAYRVLATDVRAAKEIRVFGLAPYLCGRMRSDLRRVNQIEAGADKNAAITHVLLGLLAGLATLVGAAVAVGLAAAGSLTVGDVTILITAMTTLEAMVVTTTDSASTGYRALRLFSHYLAIVERPRPTIDGGDLAPLQDAVEFRDVWFRYRNDLPWVLRGVTLTLSAGNTVGLVGMNGAGKSTLIKLLCGLYRPTKGTILWDGVDISTVNPQSLRLRISAVFQDFMAYDFSASDNIGVGSLDDLMDRSKIRLAARRATVDATLRALPNGYDTNLSRIFAAENGTSSTATLSGGEWQRVALARAFLRTEADVLVLDEPSSGLDAEVEHSLRHTLGEVSTRKLCIVASHRLSALRHADEIVVLDGGRIAEIGDHRALMRSAGRYARLFSLQAEGYAHAGVDDHRGQATIRS